MAGLPNLYSVIDGYCTLKVESNCYTERTFYITLYFTSILQTNIIQGGGRPGGDGGDGQQVGQQGGPHPPQPRPGDAEPRRRRKRKLHFQTAEIF